MQPHNNNILTIGVAGVTIPGAVDCINKMSQLAHLYFPTYHHPHIILDQPDFGIFHHEQLLGRWDLIQEILIASINRLAAAGADFSIIPANTAHKVIDGVIQHAKIPVMNMLKIVADECARKLSKQSASWEQNTR